jgi:hypothetical protein
MSGIRSWAKMIVTTVTGNAKSILESEVGQEY